MSATRVLVMEVPMLAPMMMGMAARTVNTAMGERAIRELGGEAGSDRAHGLPNSLLLLMP